MHRKCTHTCGHVVLFRMPCWSAFPLSLFKAHARQLLRMCVLAHTHVRASKRKHVQAHVPMHTHCSCFLWTGWVTLVLWMGNRNAASRGLGVHSAPAIRHDKHPLRMPMPEPRVRVLRMLRTTRSIQTVHALEMSVNPTPCSMWGFLSLFFCFSCGNECGVRENNAVHA